MTYEFELTLHSPLTKEDWNKILDAEHENTRYVTFQTPQGRQVKYIKCDVLDKIRSEINSLSTYGAKFADGLSLHIDKYDVLQIIDKYKAESEDKE